MPALSDASYHQRVGVSFNSDISSFTFDDKQEFDLAQFTEDTRSVCEKLVDIDGVVGFKLRLRFAELTFDTRYNDEESIKAHIRYVLVGAYDERDFFVHLGEEELVLTFDDEE